MQVKEKERVAEVLSVLPRGLSSEILRLSERRRAGIAGVREITARLGARCEMRILRERVPLSYRISDTELDETLSRITDGSLYAFREQLSEGYAAMRGGIRVGVSGTARSDGGDIVGISGVRTLVFRIPGGECDFAEELFGVFDSGIGFGMLIYSPPGLGKTTALRALAGYIGSGRRGYRVAVVDERCEFSAEDYSNSSVDILSGYRRAEGIGIATRTLSPDYIVTDELSAGDIHGVEDAVRSGVPLIASAHAASLSELYSKPSMKRILSGGVFSVFVGISLDGAGKYRLEVTRV